MTKAFDYKTQLTVLHQRAYEDLKDLFDAHGLSPELLSEERNTNDLSRGIFSFAVDVLRRAGLKSWQAHWVVRGIPENNFKCEYELRGGWRATYHQNIVKTVVDTYVRRVALGDRRFDVGFDNSEIPAEKFVEKWGKTWGKLEWVETANSKRFREQAGETMGDKPNIWGLYRDNEGNCFSFKNGKVSEINYMGFAFKDEKKAFEFVKWCISQEDFYIKEIGLLRNGFGGLSWADVDEHDRELEAKAEFLSVMGADVDPDQETVESEDSNSF